MPFNREVFTTRSITAFFFVVVMLTALLLSDVSFWLLVLVLHAGCWVEYERIVASFKNSFLFILFGLVYLTASWFFFLELHQHPLLMLPESGVPAPNWEQFPFFILLCMWINDTMAYIVGSLIGKTPLSPISPKKTWEGTLGGIVLTVLVVGGGANYLLGSLIPVGKMEPLLSAHWYVLALLAAIAGTWGDLLESKFKRVAGIKDSGTILPGHGGFLDRFDSLLVATPVCWIYLKLILA